MIAVETIESKAALLEKEIGPSLAVAKEIVVKDATTYQMAGETWKDLTGLEKRIKEYWEGDVDAAHKLHKSLTAKRDAMLKPVGERKTALRMEMRTFEDEEKRIRREAQAKAEAEAKREAEEAALTHAVELEANGHREAAEALIAAPVVAPPVFIPSTTPTGFGNATRRTWGAEILNLMNLVKAVAAGKVPIQAIEGNMVFLNGQARMMKSALAYPGVRAMEK
jgi:hypothetical protein